LGRDEVSVEEVEKNEEEEEEERDGRSRKDTVAGATLDVRAIILMRFMFRVQVIAMIFYVEMRGPEDRRLAAAN